MHGSTCKSVISGSYDLHDLIAVGFRIVRRGLLVDVVNVFVLKAMPSLLSVLRVRYERFTKS